jgi:mRNA (guanine-N7-)-methyltransferase
MQEVHSKASESYDAVAKTRGGEGAHVSRESPFRNFNNFAKKLLIQGALDLVLASRQSSTAFDGSCAVLDLASGRGGDLMKWMYGRSPPQNANASHGRVLRVTHYEGYDISAESVAEATRRLQESFQGKPPATCSMAPRNCFESLFWDEMSKTNPLHGTFDIVSVQFALHYACVSGKDVHRLLAAINAAVRQGGVFIATIVDGEELQQRVVSGRTANSLFSILADPKQGEDWRSPDLPVGLTYHFQLEGLVDAPEFTIPYCKLKALAESAGFAAVPVHTHKFRDLVSAHAASSSARNGLKGQALSSDEVDLVSLYRTVCFVKIGEAALD